MKHRGLIVAAGVGVVAWLLLRNRKPGSSTSSDAGLLGYTVAGAPLGLASIYFGDGETYDVNANVNSPTFGERIPN